MRAQLPKKVARSEEEAVENTVGEGVRVPVEDGCMEETVEDHRGNSGEPTGNREKERVM